MQNHNSKLKILRKGYSKFVYQNCFYRIKGGDLKISFFFKIEPDINFQPKIIIKNVKKYQIEKFGSKAFNNFIFHLGLMEIPSYWKATCSPEIIIKAGYLDSSQLNWWKNLIIDGMGQFFYENKIDWRKSNFLKIRCENNKKYEGFYKKLKNEYLVPFAGGKDSIVTLEELKKPVFAKASTGKQKKEIVLFMVNPTKQIRKTAKISGVKKQIIVERKIDKRLLRLNKKGYLNGHTPFTAILSFLSVFCAILFDCKNIAFSNEKSANEGNVRYLGKIINHQWAKSSEFEAMFKKYCKKYLAKNINYFSFLRKYSELKISKIFTKYPKYFPVFSSCNIAMKIVKEKPAYAKGSGEARWCGNCPKCLFVYLALYPFLDKKQLLKIFSKDLFQNKNLLPIMKSLLGRGKHKPFECVGTEKESRLAFELSLKKAKKFGRIPYLLKREKPQP